MRAFIRKIDNSPYEDPSNLCLFDGKSIDGNDGTVLLIEDS